MAPAPSTARHWSDRLGGVAGRLTLSVIVGAAVALLMPGGWSWTLRGLAGWCGGAGAFLFIAWSVMLACDAAATRRRCRTEDAARGTVDTLLFLATFVSVAGVGLALHDSQNGGGNAPTAAAVAIPITAAALAWLLVHTLYALHYARLYYAPDAEDADPAEAPPVAGIDFHDAPDDPAEAEPDYRDFLYVSFSIACTYGVTDVELTRKAFRRVVWKHGILSFAFATLVLALAVNVITNLLSGK